MLTNKEIDNLHELNNKYYLAKKEKLDAICDAIKKYRTIEIDDEWKDEFRFGFINDEEIHQIVKIEYNDGDYDLIDENGWYTEFIVWSDDSTICDYIIDYLDYLHDNERNSESEYIENGEDTRTGEMFDNYYKD